MRFFFLFLNDNLAWIWRTIYNPGKSTSSKKTLIFGTKPGFHLTIVNSEFKELQVFGRLLVRGTHSDMMALYQILGMYERLMFRGCLELACSSPATKNIIWWRSTDKDRHIFRWWFTRFVQCYQLLVWCSCAYRPCLSVHLGGSQKPHRNPSSVSHNQ